jgi:hypothetical protein
MTNIIDTTSWAQKHLNKELWCLDKNLYSDYNDYLKHCDVDVRTQINKATKNNIQFHRIWFINTEVPELYNAWTSTSQRQDRPINLQYEKFDGSLFTINKEKWPYELYNTDNFQLFYVYKDKIVVAYLELVIHNKVAIVHSTIGHADYLKFGIMKFLFAKTIEYKWNTIDYLTYGPTDSFSFFKEDLLIKNIWTPNGVIYEKRNKK